MVRPAATTSQSGLNNTSGTDNVCIGVYSGTENTTGQKNTYVGYQAGHTGTVGHNNVCVGNESGLNSTGESNAFLGCGSGLNSQGIQNTYIGRAAGKSSLGSTGSNNVAVGFEAGLNNTSGTDNVCIGVYSGTENTTGQKNTYVGYQAGQTGSDNFSYSTAIGANAQFTDKNQIMLGGQNDEGTYPIVVVNGGIEFADGSTQYTASTGTGGGDATLAGDNTWTGTNDFNTSLPTSSLTPSIGTQLTTKTYVDNITPNLLSSNNTWSGENLYNNKTTFTSTITVSDDTTNTLSIEQEQSSIDTSITNNQNDGTIFLKTKDSGGTIKETLSINSGSNGIVIGNGTKLDLNSQMIDRIGSAIFVDDGTSQTSAYTGAGALIGSYTNTNITIDGHGRITAISSGGTTTNVITTTYNYIDDQPQTISLDGTEQYVDFMIIGGGGGGGGGAGGGSSNGAKGGSGGSGGVCFFKYTNAGNSTTPTTTINIIIGNGGGGGVGGWEGAQGSPGTGFSGANGTDGENSSITINNYTVTALYGTRGFGGINDTNGATGSGGSSVNGLYGTDGGDGAPNPMSTYYGMNGTGGNGGTGSSSNPTSGSDGTAGKNGAIIVTKYYLSN